MLLERDRLTSGTTWHAAGLMVTFGSTSETSTEMRKYTRDLYSRLEAETGLSTGFKPIGFIELASDADRLEEYRRVSAFNRYCGIDVHEIGPSVVKELFPLARTDDILAGFYVKEDGRADPVGATMALAKGARMQGAKIIEGVPVTGVLKKRGVVTGVTTAYGNIQAEYVVNCAGAWARQLGEKSGVNIPLQAAEHYYLITETIPGLSKDWPVIEDPGCYGYYREEVGGLMIGLFEPVCAPWKIGGIPEDFSFGEIPPDWDRMGPYLEKAMSRVPVSLNTGVKKFFCGPESFTPDLKPIVGEAPELKNYFVAAGLNSIGILTGGGLGRVLAQWILTGDPGADVTGIHIDRLHTYQSNPEYRRTRTVESLGMVYQCHYPTRSMMTARGAKRSPVHDRLAAQGAYFRDVSGWESPDWYGEPGTTPDPGPLSFGRQQWFPSWAAEHKATREGVILMDMSFMAKFLVQGRDAGRLLNHISANNVDGPSGVITYTQWLNERGTLEADLTVTKLDDERYWVVASDTAHRHVETWMRRHFPDDSHAFVTDVTSAWAQINVQGPRSRELLQSVTTADLSNEAFPFRGAREIDIGFARALCVRITYLGELGYELYIPAEQAMHAYERVVEAGKQFGLRHAGLKALASLRMEKGYRDYGHDIDNTDSVLEAGLGFAVDLKKPGGFIGKEAVLAKKAAGPLKKRMIQVLVQDPEPMLFHAEVVRRNGKPVGYVRAGSYGHTLGGAVGLVMAESHEPIDAAWLESGQWDVEIAGKRYPVTASLRPLYDPDMKRIKI
ncbi:Sarcosine dehydrogenase [Hyalangium minutum]|uniref:Sarcosine dehydrogenase n=1 Tax=Hyalangium minutum TaxID=394096 RepID=A0A085W843_9BACT|nr:Sarcosine dehydrogenase [Hyalangium minutum]